MQGEDSEPICASNHREAKREAIENNAVNQNESPTLPGA